MVKKFFRERGFSGIGMGDDCEGATSLNFFLNLWSYEHAHVSIEGDGPRQDLCEELLTNAYRLKRLVSCTKILYLFTQQKIPLGLEPRLEEKMSTSANSYYVTTFYRFIPLQNLTQIQMDLEKKADSLNVKGLVILSHEGFNATCAAEDSHQLVLWKNFIRLYFKIPQLFFKDSVSDVAPFRRFKIKVRSEIVTAGVPDRVPPEGRNHHLTPAEWHQVLQEENDFVLIDTRNWYEYKIGTFKGALNPDIEKFTDFPDYIEAQGISKNKKMLIFCTGGIRCEKGILELQEQGYDNVYQLEGGILNYIKEFPREKFEGECFVFDHRVALDQDLLPSKTYGLCPHCGQPSHVKIVCKRCDTQEALCDECVTIDFKKDTCSKNCAHQYQLFPDRKGPKQLVPFVVEKMHAQGKKTELPQIQVSRRKMVIVNGKGIAKTFSS